RSRKSSKASCPRERFHPETIRKSVALPVSVTHQRLAILEKSVEIRRSAVLLTPAFRRSWKGPPLDPARLRRMGTRKQTGHPLPPPAALQGVQQRKENLRIPRRGKGRVFRMVGKNEK